MSDKSNVRELIVSRYKQLQQLEAYEDFIEYAEDKGKHHWWQIKTPDKFIEINIAGKGSRKKFLEFVKSEILRLKEELGIDD